MIGEESGNIGHRRFKLVINISLTSVNYTDVAHIDIEKYYWKVLKSGFLKIQTLNDKDCMIDCVNQRY